MSGDYRVSYSAAQFLVRYLALTALCAVFFAAFKEFALAFSDQIELLILTGLVLAAGFFSASCLLIYRRLHRKKLSFGWYICPFSCFSLLSLMSEQLSMALVACAVHCLTLLVCLNPVDVRESDVRKAESADADVKKSEAESASSVSPVRVAEAVTRAIGSAAQSKSDDLHDRHIPA